MLVRSPRHPSRQSLAARDRRRDPSVSHFSASVVQASRYERERAKRGPACEGRGYRCRAASPGQNAVYRRVSLFTRRAQTGGSLSNVGRRTLEGQKSPLSTGPCKTLEMWKFLLGRLFAHHGNVSSRAVEMEVERSIRSKTRPSRRFASSSVGNAPIGLVSSSEPSWTCGTPLISSENREVEYPSSRH